MAQLFADYAAIIVFLHVIGAVIWVGGMIAIRVTVHPSLQSIDTPELKLGKTLEIVGRLFNLVIPFIVLILLTAIIMIVAMGFKESDLFSVVIAKEAIWTIMTANFIFMYVKRNKAQKLFSAGDLPAAKAQVALLPNVLLPINLVLGVVAVFLGVTLRGF